MSITKAVTYTTKNVADICGVSIGTVQNWVQSNEIKSCKLPGSQFARIYVEDLVPFMRLHGFRIPPEVAEHFVEKTT